MESQTQHGLAIVWGPAVAAVEAAQADGTFTGTGVGIGYFIESDDLTKTIENEPHYDPTTASVLGRTYFRSRTTLKLRVFPGPVSGTNTIANAYANNLLPPVGREIIISPTGPTPDKDICPDGSFTRGYYVVEECGKQRKMGDKAFFDITVTRDGDGSNGTTTRISQLISA
jgi:hypothetical protein